MKPGFFIERPVFSIVISILIVLVGFISIAVLPVDQYPKITPPLVKISANYSGASSVTVSEAVATPIEQELNGTPGMIYMQSTCSNSGSLTIEATFEVGTDPEIAAVDVQNRVKLAESRLPAEVVENGVSVQQQAAGQLMTICLKSSDPKFDEVYLSNFATLNVNDLLLRVPGVGSVGNIGSRYYSMRVWVYPDKLTSYGLTVSDLTSAIKDQNRESAAGELGLQPNDSIDITIPLSTAGRLQKPEDFEEIILRANEDGSVIRLRDVARVKLEASSYNEESGYDNENAAIIYVYLLSGANALDVANKVKEEMKRISRNFPEGINYSIPHDMTDYIKASIKEVYVTLLEALLLVVLVVFLSLQNWRATLIPIIAVPVSLIGTFTFMLAFGFSINLLTLLGLILAIGIVVDDAIVVVENVERLMHHQKLSPREATHKAMKELTGALIATSLVLVAVFVPVSFLGGISGELYKQFSVTIAVSVILSTIVALTLSPALCAIILKPEKSKSNRVFDFINKWLDKGTQKYTGLISSTIAVPKRIFVGFGLVFILILALFRFIPETFIPEEDQGQFTIELELPEGATLRRTAQITERAVSFILKNPAVKDVEHVTGLSPRLGTSQPRAKLTVMLKDWSDREDKESQLNAIIEDVSAELYRYPEARFYISKPPLIPGLGDSGGFELQLEAKSGASWENLVAANDTLLYYANQCKELESVSSKLQAGVPKLHFNVDRDAVLLLGIPLADVFSTMSAFLGSINVNDFNMFNRIYKVKIQADENYRLTKDNLNMFSVRAKNGAMIPITAVGSLDYTTGPGNIKKFNMFNAAVVNGQTASGYSSGQAMNKIEELVRSKLPHNIDYEWSGMSYQEKQAGGKTGIVMLMVLVFVFLFLAAQFESWLIPVSVLTSIPIAILGSLLGVWVLGLENDIYYQVGMVTLIGLSAKNAILIVEVAKQQMESGVEVVEAALNAAKLRFRPIIMTSMAFVLGMLPLVFATGPGSASRRSIGTGVFFGMLACICFGIIVVPFFFVMINKAIQRIKRK